MTLKCFQAVKHSTIKIDFFQLKKHNISLKSKASCNRKSKISLKRITSPQSISTLNW